MNADDANTLIIEDGGWRRERLPGWLTRERLFYHAWRGRYYDRVGTCWGMHVYRHRVQP